MTEIKILEVWAENLCVVLEASSCPVADCTTNRAKLCLSSQPSGVFSLNSARICASSLEVDVCLKAKKREDRKIKVLVMII